MFADLKLQWTNDLGNDLDDSEQAEGPQTKGEIYINRINNRIINTLIMSN